MANGYLPRRTCPGCGHSYPASQGECPRCGRCHSAAHAALPLTSEERAVLDAMDEHRACGEHAQADARLRTYQELRRDHLRLRRRELEGGRRHV